jgi:hypothetical protein
MDADPPPLDDDDTRESLQGVVVEHLREGSADGLGRLVSEEDNDSGMAPWAGRPGYLRTLVEGDRITLSGEPVVFPLNYASTATPSCSARRWPS